MLNKLRQWLTSEVSSSTSESSPAPANRAAGSPAEDVASLLSRWSQQALDGRRLDVFRPAGDIPPNGAVLFLHGHGRVLLSENAVFSAWLQKFNLYAYCPDGARSWWLDVICPEFDPEQTPQCWLMDRVVPRITEDTGIEPPHVALLGVSMGGQGALQLAYRYASQFPIVSAISPAVDFQQLHGSGIPLDAMFPDAEAARQATVVLNLHPLAWPRFQYFCCDPADTEWFDGAARLGMKLSSSGILHERDLETSAGGHTWSYFNHMAERALRHISDSLQKL